MSPSEVHAPMQRARRSHLLHGPQLKGRPNFRALEEFLPHGLTYIFSPERGELTRGAALSRRGTSPFPSGRTRRAGNGASRLSRCTRLRPSRPSVTRPFASTWPDLFLVLSLQGLERSLHLCKGLRMCAYRDQGLLARPEFLDALPGWPRPDAASQSRFSILPRRLNDCAAPGPITDHHGNRRCRRRRHRFRTNTSLQEDPRSAVEQTPEREMIPGNGSYTEYAARRK